VVLAGGGAFGAYEAGALKALEKAGLKPAMLAGVSSGAINAVVWLAHQFRADVVVGAWREIRPATIGLRWTTIGLRAAGSLLLALGLLQTALALLGSSSLLVSRGLGDGGLPGPEMVPGILDAVAWAIIATVGALMAGLSRRAESWLSTWEGPRHAAGLSRWLGRGLLLGLAFHVITWGLDVPWPRSFSASVLVAGAVVYLMILPGPTADRARAMVFRLIPEARGPGLWGPSTRRKLMIRLVGAEGMRHLTGGDTLLVITALALEDGRITHFVSGPSPGDMFRQRVERGLGRVVEVERPMEMVDAAVASSAIPLLFEPVRIRGHDYVDAGQFSNQPLAAALAAEADAVVVVLLVPPAALRPRLRGDDLVSLGSRLVEIANWRSLQIELAALPKGWTEGGPGSPRRAVLVAPTAALPGGLLGFDPVLAEQMIALGEADTLRALRESGWIASESQVGT
jgi:predicted acylesterase/phospholipase RssA